MTITDSARTFLPEALAIILYMFGVKPFSIDKRLNINRIETLLIINSQKSIDVGVKAFHYIFPTEVHKYINCSFLGETFIYLILGGDDKT